MLKKLITLACLPAISFGLGALNPTQVQKITQQDARYNTQLSQSVANDFYVNFLAGYAYTSLANSDVFSPNPTSHNSFSNEGNAYLSGFELGYNVTKRFALELGLIYVGEVFGHGVYSGYRLQQGIVQIDAKYRFLNFSHFATYFQAGATGHGAILSWKNIPGLNNVNKLGLVDISPFGGLGMAIKFNSTYALNFNYFIYPRVNTYVTNSKTNHQRTHINIPALQLFTIGFAISF